jgi:serine protease AprX
MSVGRISCMIAVLSLLLPASSAAQKYWLKFTDKENTPYSIDRPEEFLTPRSVDRRIRQQIPVTEEDLPVTPSYIDSLMNMGVRVINISRWFNGAMVEADDTLILETLDGISFIEDSPLALKPAVIEKSTGIGLQKLEVCGDTVGERIYGPSFNQVGMIGGDILHREGFKGEGMLIAIIDAGFTNADSVSSLTHIWDQGRVLACRDFVKDGKDFFETHNHGTQILSIIGGMEEGMLQGTAPEADFLLIRTEDGASEFLIEEYNWICGAEFADSMGADVINSSLGYSLFDDSLQNHTYDEMDGNSAPISIAAQKASLKGIIVVTSAGNEGEKDWYHITSPADAGQVLAVGATDSKGEITRFSSRGPSFDGRIKPDVCAQGYETVSQHSGGKFAYCAGTSCSSPVIAGMVACLWQSMPSLPAVDIIEYLRQSGSRFSDPDEEYGYGIPDFIMTSVMLRDAEEYLENSLTALTVFPSPASFALYVSVAGAPKADTRTISLLISDLQGKMQYSGEQLVTGKSFALKVPDVSFLATGIYLLNIELDGVRYPLLFSKW